MAAATTNGAQLFPDLVIKSGRVKRSQRPLELKQTSVSAAATLPAL